MSKVSEASARQFVTLLARERARVGGESSKSPTATYEQLARSGFAVYPGFMTGEYMNHGFWRRGARDRRQASEALIEELIARIPDRTGTILDVACGLGFTTAYLCRHWSAVNVHGINIGEEQLVGCRRNAPHCSFHLMDATDLNFDDQSFDSVLCVEAAFHFDTREKFLRETHRVLRPGGVLAMTDILLRRESLSLLPSWLSANYLPSAQDYHALLLDAGFERAEVLDITEDGSDAWLRYMFSRVHEDWLDGRCDFNALTVALKILYTFAVAYACNLMCFAWKRAVTRP